MLPQPRNQRGVEVLLFMLVLLRRVFYVHKREREREIERARARLERETIAQRGDTMMMMMMMMTKKKTKKKRTTVLTVKQRHFPQSAGVHLRADAGERAHEGCRRREKHSIIE